MMNHYASMTLGDYLRRRQPEVECNALALGFRVFPFVLYSTFCALNMISPPFLLAGRLKLIGIHPDTPQQSVVSRQM